MKFIKPTSWKEPSQVDISKVANLLGKDPQGEFQIIVYDEATPLIIENSPFFYDGTPMPTRYWILESDIFNKISKLESSGAIKKMPSTIANVPEMILVKYKKFMINMNLLGMH